MHVYVYLVCDGFCTHWLFVSGCKAVLCNCSVTSNPVFSLLRLTSLRQYAHLTFKVLAVFLLLNCCHTECHSILARMSFYIGPMAMLGKANWHLPLWPVADLGLSPTLPPGPCPLIVCQWCRTAPGDRVATCFEVVCLDVIHSLHMQIIYICLSIDLPIYSINITW